MMEFFSCACSVSVDVTNLVHNLPNFFLHDNLICVLLFKTGNNHDYFDYILVYFPPGILLHTAIISYTREHK